MLQGFDNRNLEVKWKFLELCKNHVWVPLIQYTASQVMFSGIFYSFYVSTILNIDPHLRFLWPYEWSVFDYFQFSKL